jgi:malic enzyme
MKPYLAPLDAIMRGESAPIDRYGAALLGSRLLTKDLAFDARERAEFRLDGLLSDGILTIEQQAELEIEHLRRKSSDLERYIGLAALQDRNATLYYRVLVENLEELLPIVYTPTVGQACQEFSHIVRRTRGTWITPDNVHRIPDLLRNGPFDDVRLIVVTDNERILGLGDQGAGGMGIPLGKLALYTAGSGIHPSLTLPVSLDVGTDNPTLLADPLYIGHRAPRLRGATYDELVEAFVAGVAEVWPDAIIQWEDFKQQNALRILARYRDRICSFNDDIQGTSAVLVGGLLAGLRARDSSWSAERIVLAGAGAAGIGIGRLIRAAMVEAGMANDDIDLALVYTDSKGLVHEGRTDLDETKRAIALPLSAAHRYGLLESGAEGADLATTVEAVRPTILIGTTATGGIFTERIIRAVAAGSAHPIIMPLSNPTSATEAVPADVLAWSEGRAYVATGSPFAPVLTDGRERVIGQANNVFIFPGLGLGVMAAEASRVNDAMILAAAHAMAGLVSAERLAAGALYPAVSELRAVSYAVALAVAQVARASGLARVSAGTDLASEVLHAMWWPAYAPYRLKTPSDPAY